MERLGRFRSRGRCPRTATGLARVGSQDSQWRRCTPTLFVLIPPTLTAELTTRYRGPTFNTSGLSHCGSRSDSENHRYSHQLRASQRRSWSSQRRSSTAFGSGPSSATGHVLDRKDRQARPISRVARRRRCVVERACRACLGGAPPGRRRDGGSVSGQADEAGR